MHCLEQLHWLEGVTVHLIICHHGQNRCIICLVFEVSVFSKTLSLLFGLPLGLNLHLKGDLVHSEATGVCISIKYWFGFSLMLCFQEFKQEKAFSF